MLTVMINQPGKTTVPMGEIESITVFVNNEAGHKKPFITINGKGEMYFPKTSRQRAVDFYELLDRQEQALGEAVNG